ncbi:hypothetical protein JOQ06_000831 [Pogonophryne albipinna]|uniref:Uncharacterized protein n=1 Tax=Pogonophryne albipinna TaxID=1090488 RepID=A0AAD6B4N3_9TELE|nr:hypothetical protein JOQ06_000831 [Pogonophryne albipinna]
MASITSTSTPDPPLACPEVPGTARRDTPFSLALKGKLTKEKTEEFHRAVTAFVVKGLHPFSVVEAPSFREMTKALNPKYTPPSRDSLSN